MRYRDVELRGIPAVTKSGEKLGKLVAFEIDTAHHEVTHYVVSRTSLFARLLPSELLVAPGQVVSIDTDLMVVEDGAVAVREEKKAMPMGAEAAASVSQRGE
jgi:uncharacterized protein YrrD